MRLGAGGEVRMRALIIGDSIIAQIRPQLEAEGHVVVAQVGWSVNAFLQRSFQTGRGPSSLSQLVDYLASTGHVDRVLIALGTNPGDDIGLQAFAAQVRTLWAVVTRHGWPAKWIGPWAGPQAQDRLDVVRAVVGAHRALDGRAVATGLEHAADGIHFRVTTDSELARRVLGVVPSIRPWWFPVYVAGVVVAGALGIGLAIAGWRARRRA